MNQYTIPGAPKTWVDSETKIVLHPEWAYRGFDQYSIVIWVDDEDLAASSEAVKARFLGGRWEIIWTGLKTIDEAITVIKNLILFRCAMAGFIEEAVQAIYRSMPEGVLETLRKGRPAGEAE